MPRIKKRKILVNKNKENVTQEASKSSESLLSKSTAVTNDTMCRIMSMAQYGGPHQNKYLKELHNLYKSMDHDAFMKRFIVMIKSAMEGDEKNKFASTSLLFCAKFSTSFTDTNDAHPVLTSTFRWLLSTISFDPHIRYRLCQFVNFMLNALGNEASLEDEICDSILTYMIERLRDISANVRIQAILALQRLQIPNNPDDVVVKAYQFHLSSDPSPRVRQAVITAIGRNYHTIPYIIERLWDVDEKVRRHTYLHMSSYPVKAYKVSQRLKFLEQGLNDRSESVRKVLTTVLLPQWFESYNKNFISFISALKLDANNEEVARFRKITKVALKEMFKKRKIHELIENLPLEKDSESEFVKCVPVSKLSVEVTLYWLTLIEYLQDKDEVDEILPELSVFCLYAENYCQSIKQNMDKWEKMEHQYVLLTLMEILYLFDLGDEIGREKLKNLLEVLLKDYDLGERIIEIIVKCIENLIDDQEKRLQYFVDLVKDLLDTRDSKLNDISNGNLLDEFLEKQLDSTIKIKFSSLKLKILELKEQEVNFIEKKDYVNAEKITEGLNNARDEYNQFLKYLIDQFSLNASTSDEPLKILLKELQQVRKLTTEIIMKCLKISFYMIASKKINSLTPNVNQLYQDFFRRYIESNSISIRDWALKCGTACSMLYEQISKDVFTELHAQFFKTSSPKIWKTTIDCLFELLDRYGLSHFDVEQKLNKERKQGRQLYNTLEFLDLEEETSSSGGHGSHVSVIYMLSHFLDTCEETSVITAIVKGFGRLILHDHIQNDDILEKLLIKYFNPATDSQTNQILGVFFEQLMKLKKQECLRPCLLPTITTIFGAPYDSPLREIKVEAVLKFIIDSTRPEFCSEGLNIHNTIAFTFMDEIKSNVSNRDLLRILSKELITLETSVADDETLRKELKICCEKILENNTDSIIGKNILNFKNILDGIHTQSMKNRTTDGNAGTDEENDSDVEEGKNIVTPVEKQNDENNESQQNITVIEYEKTPPQSTNDKQQQKLHENIENKEQEKEKEQEKGKDKTDVISKELNVVERNSATINQIVDRNQENSTAMSKKQNQVINMPTTYGKDNRTDLRYLRKSLNVGQRSSEDESPTRSPRIRIEAKLESGSKHKNAVLQENQSYVARKDSVAAENSKPKPRNEKRKSNQVISTSEEETPKQNSRTIRNQAQGKEKSSAENQHVRSKKKKQKLTEEQQNEDANAKSVDLTTQAQRFLRSRTSNTQALNASAGAVKSKKSTPVTKKKDAEPNKSLSSSSSSLSEVQSSSIIQRTRNRIIRKPKTTEANAENRTEKSKYPLVKILLKTTQNERATGDVTRVVGTTARKGLDLSESNVNLNVINSIVHKTLRSSSNRSSGVSSIITKTRSSSLSKNSIIITDSTVNDLTQNRRGRSKTAASKSNEILVKNQLQPGKDKKHEQTTPVVTTSNEISKIRTRSAAKNKLSI